MDARRLPSIPGVLSGLHSLAGHRDKLTIDADAEKGAEFMRPRVERSRLGEGGQLDHRPERRRRRG